MRQTLLRIPLDADWSFGLFGGVPGFGIGLLLAVWIVLGGIRVYRNRKELSAASVLVPAVMWCLLAFAIVKIPDWVQKAPRTRIAAQTAIIEQQVQSPRLAEHYLQRGQAHEQVYEYEQAARDYRSAIDLAPERDAGYLQLAWLKATCAEEDIRNGEEAVALAQAAFEKAPAQTAIHWDTLAAAYAEQEEFAKAEELAQTAARHADASRELAHRERLAEIRDRLEKYGNQHPHRAPRFSQQFPQSLPIRGYGFMMFLGFIAAGLTSIRLVRRAGITADVVWDVGIWSLFGGIVGARIFYLVQYHERVFTGRSGFDLIKAPFELQEGGLVLLGGLVLGSCVFLAYCWFRKIKPLLMADVAVPAFFVALAFGRVGCLMNGCCYGDRCELPWAIQFPLGSVPDMALVLRGFLSPASLSSMPLHPSQIYSSLNALVLAFLTATYFRYRYRDGAVLAMGMLTYPITRFSIEYLRGDEMGQFGTGFTISQLVSMGIFCAGLVFLFWLSRHPQQATIVPAEDASPKPGTQNPPARAAAG